MLTDGDPAYTLVQVSVNDLLTLVFFAAMTPTTRSKEGTALPRSGDALRVRGT